MSCDLYKGYNNAYRLIRTETTFVTGQMDAQAYEACDVDKYIYVATLDLRTSKICRSLDGKTFKMKDMKVGVNYPPMHPWCRSTTIGWLPDSWRARMKRRARDPKTGKSITVPANMTYGQWYEKYVANTPISDTMNADNNEVKDVQRIGFLDISKYKGVTNKGIRSKELILTDRQKDHIIKRRGADFYEKYSGFFNEVANDPDYIFKDGKHENTAIASKTIKENDANINLVIRLAVETDDDGIENSIITAIKENDKRYAQRIRNNIPVYKKEMK